MTKSEQAEVKRAIMVAKRDPNMAAGMLATLHRSARTSRSQMELYDVMASECLLQYLERVNGAYVLRVGA